MRKCTKKTSSAQWYWGKIALLKKMNHYQNFLRYKEMMKKARPEMTACRLMYQYLCNHCISGYNPSFYLRGSKNAKH